MLEYRTTKGKIWFPFFLLYSGALAASRAPNPYRKLEKTHELIFSSVVTMASSIARGHVCRTAVTTTAESRKMVAILQIIGWQRHATLVYLVLFWYIMLWSIHTFHIKLSADQCHVVYSLSRSSVLIKLTADKVLVFDWITGSCQVTLLKTELGCLEAC